MALVAFDNTILSVLLFPDADLRQGTDAAPVDRARERVRRSGAGACGGRRTGSDSDACPGRGAGHAQDATSDEVLSALRVSAYIRIGDFDLRAAVELGGSVTQCGCEG